MTARFGRFASAKPSTSDAVRINLAGTRYSVVKNAAEELGMVAVEDGSANCNVYWVDGAIPLEKFLELKPYQRINHFPGMGEISRKDCLARNSQRMQKLNRSEYGFVPATWVLPADHSTLTTHFSEAKRKGKKKTFIVKPYNSSMGNGIYLTRSPNSIPLQERVIVQEYLEKPFLLEGFKCDLRVYVLVTSCDPLRIFVYKDGLVRLSTEHYSAPSDANLDKDFMHLTNYSINKHSDSFDSDERLDRGSKRSLQVFTGWLGQRGYNAVEMWSKIYDVVVKTLIIAHPHLLHSYSVCRRGQRSGNKSQFFEVLGFDILLDHTLKPWLLEVNRSPSFGTDAALDLSIKTGVVRDALRLARIRSSDKHQNAVAQKEAVRRRLYVHPRSATVCDFQLEQEEVKEERGRRKQQVKDKLSQLRREREMEEYEEANKGDYVQVYPTTDPLKARLYSKLLREASTSSLTLPGRRSSSAQRRPTHPTSGCGHLLSGCGLMGELKEEELVDLLSQYEDSNMTATFPELSCPPSISSFHSNSLQSSSPLSNMYSAMAMRMEEEEQTQRTMVSLNETAPFYPGKEQEDVASVLEKINLEFEELKLQIHSFWFNTLNTTKRKQLLVPVREMVNRILCSHWRVSDLSGLRLHHITSRLMSFLVRRGGHGLWMTIEPPDDSSWEATFKKKLGVISVPETVCCRRIVQLCQAMLFAGFYYHYLQPRTKHKSSSLPGPSLPHINRHSSITSSYQQFPPI